MRLLAIILLYTIYLTLVGIKFYNYTKISYGFALKKAYS